MELGVARSYTEQLDGNMLPNYPPFSLLLFQGTGYLYKWTVSPDYDKNLPAYRTFIKLPAIIADLATAALFFFVLWRWKGIKAGYLGAALYTFHPAVFYDSAIWGQTDGIFTCFLCFALAFFANRKYALSGAFVVLAALTKAQTVMLLPLFAFLFFFHAGWKGLLKGAGSGFVVLCLALLPFALGGALDDVVKVYVGSVGFYSIVTSAAYNFWWSLLGDAGHSTSSETVLFGIASYKRIGFGLFGLSYLFLLPLVWRRLITLKPDISRVPYLFAAATFACHAFFLFNTEMHERYLFPFVALGLPAAFISRKSAWLYGVVSLLFLMNLLGWLPWTIVDKELYKTFVTLDVFIASFQVFAFFSYASMLKELLWVPLTRKEWTALTQPLRRMLTRTSSRAV